MSWYFKEDDITNKDVLLDVLRKSDPKYQYCGVAIANTDFPTEEIIINPRINFAGKADYYERAYNDCLVLNTCDKIRISAVHLFEKDNEIE